MNELLSVLIKIVLVLFIPITPVYAEQLNEIEKNLPVSINTKEIVEWVFPNKNNDFVKIIQARKWKTSQYIIVLCVIKNPIKTEELELGKGGCGSGKFDVYIGVITHNEKDYNFDYRTDFPISMNADENYERYYIMLDLAPYKVNEKTTSIGLRMSSSTAYAGGGQGREQLWLLMPYRKQLHDILSLEVHDYEIIATDWNSDGSRNHIGYDYKSTLHVLKTQTNGFYDFLVRTARHDYENKEIKKSIIQARYIWSEEKRQYVPQNERGKSGAN